MTALQQKAIALEAAGKMTAEQMAKEVGVSRRTIHTWKADKEFQAEVKKLKNAWREAARGSGVADQDFRLRARNDRHKRLRAVIAQRAKDELMKDVPGGNTGLLTVIFKMRSDGKDAGQTAVPEYAVDKPLLDALLELEEDQAVDLGQWKAKVEHSGSVDINEIMARLHAGRKRVAEAKAKRDAAERQQPD